MCVCVRVGVGCSVFCSALEPDPREEAAEKYERCSCCRCRCRCRCHCHAWLLSPSAFATLSISISPPMRAAADGGSRWWAIIKMERKEGGCVCGEGATSPVLCSVFPACIPTLFFVHFVRMRMRQDPAGDIDRRLDPCDVIGCGCPPHTPSHFLPPTLRHQTEPNSSRAFHCLFCAFNLLNL